MVENFWLFAKRFQCIIRDLCWESKLSLELHHKPKNNIMHTTITYIVHVNPKNIFRLNQTVRSVWSSVNNLQAKDVCCWRVLACLHCLHSLKSDDVLCGKRRIKNMIERWHAMQMCVHTFGYISMPNFEGCVCFVIAWKTFFPVVQVQFT